MSSHPRGRRRRPRLGSWVLTLAVLLAGAAGSVAGQGRLRLAPAGSILPPGGATLPVQWWCEYPLATVTLGDRGPFTFLIDTGASICVVDRELAAELPGDVVPTRLRAVGARGESVLPDGVLRLASLRVGELVLEDLDALVLDLEPVAEVLRTPLHGILGYGAFVGLLLELDYPERRVRALWGNLPAPGDGEVLALLPGLVPRVALALGPATVAVTLDSGSGGGLELAGPPGGVELLAGPVRDLGALTAGGLGPPRELARLDADLELGGHRVTRPVVTWTPGEARLGADLLRHFRWTFDPLGGRVRVERRAAEPVVMGPVRSSGLGLVRRGGALVVGAVLPGSPAEVAGLRPGDRVLSIDGRPVAGSADCETLGERLRAGAVVRAVVERAGEALEFAWDVLVLLP